MKRLLTILCTVLLSAPTFSQNTLTIHQKDGQQFSYGFEEKPVVTFTDNTMVITSTKTQVQYDLSVIEKFTFDDIEDAVIGIKADAASASITLDEYTVSISGAKPDTQVRLLASDGRQLQSYKTAQDGSVTFSIADLPTGNYIIASESIIVKILKK